MIKMKGLITEDIDTDIKHNIDQIGVLQKEIDEIQKKLKPLKKEYGELIDNVLPILSKLGKEQMKTRNYIFKIIRKGYERQSFQYKEGFNKALGKVNNNIKKILEQILDDTKKMVDVKPKFQISPINEGFTDWLKSFTRKVLKNIIKPMKSVVSANKDLRKLI
jgi:FtsZ-binding cell division protein ZapB